MPCCSKARAQAKVKATKKATAKAVKLNQLGKVATPKPRKVAPAKVKPAKATPCTLCGKKSQR